MELLSAARPFNLQEFTYGGRRIISLARPAYGDTDSWKTDKEEGKDLDITPGSPIWSKIEPLITQDLIYLKERGVGQIISFSNSFYVLHMDTIIRKIWARICPEGVFSSISTEDFLFQDPKPEDHLEKKPQPPDLIAPEKLDLFYSLTLPEASPLTAVYCGAGLGRSGGYIAGWAAKQDREITSERDYDKRVELINALIEHKLAPQYHRTTMSLRNSWIDELKDTGAVEAIARSLE